MKRILTILGINTAVIFGLISFLILVSEMHDAAGIVRLVILLAIGFLAALVGYLPFRKQTTYLQSIFLSVVAYNGIILVLDMFGGFEVYTVFNILFLILGVYLIRKREEA